MDVVIWLSGIQSKEEHNEYNAKVVAKTNKPQKLTKSPCLLHVHMLYLGEVMVNRKNYCAKPAKLR